MQAERSARKKRENSAQIVFYVVVLPPGSYLMRKEKRMSRRKLITMTDEEIQAFLQEERTLQVATIDHAGYPHLVAMWYTLVDQQILFWTYARSQEAGNLRRDPPVTCLVVTGERYVQLRGVQIQGQAV